MMRFAVSVLLVVSAAVAAGCASVAPAPAPTSVPPTPPAPDEPPEETVRLRFGTDAELARWIVSGGDWRVDHEVAVGTQLGDEYAYLTWPVYYGRISSVVVRGRIVSKNATNFRVAVGDVAALLNWEGGPVNVFRQGWDVAKHVGPRALDGIRDHEIRFDEEDGRIFVRVDGRALWETRGHLRGTVTVYPAIGSSIVVREVEIRGVPVPWIRVDGPSNRVP